MLLRTQLKVAAVKASACVYGLLTVLAECRACQLWLIAPPLSSLRLSASPVCCASYQFDYGHMDFTFSSKVGQQQCA